MKGKQVSLLEYLHILGELVLLYLDISPPHVRSINVYTYIYIIYRHMALCTLYICVKTYRYVWLSLSVRKGLVPGPLWIPKIYRY